MTQKFVRGVFAVMVGLIGIVCVTPKAVAETAYGLTAANTIIVFDTATPGTTVRTITLNVGLAGRVVAIDLDETGRRLYAITSGSRMFEIDVRAPQVTLGEGPSFSLNGTAFGLDLNPIDGFLRVVTNTGQNLRLNPATRGILSVDAPLSPAGSVVACAFTNRFLGIEATTTTLYGIDSASDTLVRQGSIDGTPVSPDTGALTTIGPLGVDTAATVGFDIGFANQAFASLTVGGVSGLYTINLSSGAATLVGNFGAGVIVEGLAVHTPVATDMYGLTDGQTLIRFNTADPGTIRGSVTITGLQPNETIVGLDERVTNSQLYAVGSTSRLYAIDAATGVATQIGPGPFSPALAGASFGVTHMNGWEFLQIVSDAEQNLLVNDRTGIATPFPPLAPAGEVVAAEFIQRGATEGPVATMYGIDAASDQLIFIGPRFQTPGTSDGAITVVGSLGVDTSAAASFDESSDGTVWAALQVGGLSRLYTIDLETGRASLTGTIGTGAPLQGLTAAMPDQVRFSSNAYFVDEGSGTATFTVIRSGSTVGRLEVQATTYLAAGGATPGVDFTPTTQTLVFTEGVAAATFSVPLLEDTADERDDIFGIQLSGPVEFPREALVWIQDNDGPDALPTITITSPTTSPTFTAHGYVITLAGAASDDVGVASVTWSTGRRSGTADGTTDWTAANIPLDAGTNVLTVRAIDTQGGSRVAVLTVTVGDLLYSLAEGSTGAFFDTDILLANPHNVPVAIETTFLKEDGTTVTQAQVLAPSSRTTIPVASVPGLEATAMSTFVRTQNAPQIAVERTVHWDRSGYGAHTETARPGAAAAWYFAEGSQGFFNTFLMLANPGATPNSAVVEFLLEDGTTVTKTCPLAPTSRLTLFAGDVPELVNQSFGTKVTFAEPGMAERAMYFGTPLFNAGHASAGATAPSKTWLFAEGATGSFFTTFLLFANPGTAAGDVTVTFLPAGGTPVSRTYSIGGKQRLTINIAAEAPSLADTAVGARVTATVPIVAERAQYWPGPPDQWYEAHNSLGVTDAETKWTLAEGRVGGPRAYQTYILLANSSGADAMVTIDFLREPGRSPQTVAKTFSVRAGSRFNVAVPSPDVPELTDETFGALITSTAPIVVERAMYSDVNGQVWASGTNAVAARVP